jgi:asparagine synthase (glutamine-hydrolysing)
MISDVPIGAFLSGGIDSSSVVGLMAKNTNEKIKTFTIGFKEESFNEIHFAQEVVKKYQTEQTEYILAPDPKELIDIVIPYLDEPFADTSFYPTFIVSHLAAQSVKVALTGDGGDELFGGYDWYQADLLASKLMISNPEFLKPIFRLLSKLPPSFKKKATVNIIRKFFGGLSLPYELRSMRWHCFFNESDKTRLLSNRALNGIQNNHLNFNQFIDQQLRNTTLEYMYYDLNLYLPEDLLIKVDKMSMANSLECRVPLLDHELIEYAATIPLNFKMRLGENKIIFKESMKEILPAEIYNRKQKIGFAVPMQKWFQKELLPLVKYYFFSYNQTSEFFNELYLKNLLNDHLKNRFDNSPQIRSVLLFLIWHNNFYRNR